MARRTHEARVTRDTLLSEQAMAAMERARAAGDTAEARRYLGMARRFEEAIASLEEVTEPSPT